MALSKYDENGQEIVDPTPMALPVGFERPKPLSVRIRELVRDEALRQELMRQGIETFDEADDFDMPDDPVDRTTPYEDNFDPEHPGIAARQQELRAGFVEDIPLERKRKAYETISSHRIAKNSSSKKTKSHEDEEEGGKPNTI